MEIEQIADGVGVLAAVQPVQNRRAGIRVSARLGIEPRFERGLQALVGRLVRPLRPLRRHGARLQLADDFLPDFGMRSSLCGVEAFEREAPGFEALVMAGDAVPIDNGAIWRSGGSGRRRLS